MHLEVSTDQKALVTELAARYADTREGYTTLLSIEHAEGMYSLVVSTVETEDDPEEDEPTTPS